jgi:hypothetical protein
LVEMLVVISILALLMTLTAPAVTRAMTRAKREGCISNMRHIGYAFLSYAAEHNGAFPTGKEWGSGSGHRRIGWDDLLAPYDGRGVLEDSVAEIPFLDRHNYDGANHKLYICPASPYLDTKPGYRTSYAVHRSGHYDEDGIFGGGTWERGVLHPETPNRGAFSLKMHQIPYPSNSIVLMERHLSFEKMGSGSWARLADFNDTHADSLNTSWWPTLEHQWVHGTPYMMHFLFADGSVRFLHMEDTVADGVTWYNAQREVENGMWDCYPR